MLMNSVGVKISKSEDGHTHTHTHETTTVTLSAHTRRGLMTNHRYYRQTKYCNNTITTTFVISNRNTSAVMGTILPFLSVAMSNEQIIVLSV